MPDPGCAVRNRVRAVTRRPRKRATKETADGVRAWLFLRHVEAYEAAWRGHAVLPAPEPVFEPGPFPIRIQTAADLEAARFDLRPGTGPLGGRRPRLGLLGAVRRVSSIPGRRALNASTAGARTASIHIELAVMR